MIVGVTWQSHDHQTGNQTGLRERTKPLEQIQIFSTLCSGQHKHKLLSCSYSWRGTGPCSWLLGIRFIQFIWILFHWFICFIYWVFSFFTGLILILVGLLKLGFMVNFISHPVITGSFRCSLIMAPIPYAMGPWVSKFEVALSVSRIGTGYFWLCESDWGLDHQFQKFISGYIPAKQKYTNKNNSYMQ